MSLHHPTTSALLAAARRLAAPVALVMAAAFVVGHLIQAHKAGFLATDFKLFAAQRLLDGETLYPPSGPDSGNYPYPPIWAMLITPLLLLAHLAAQYVAAILCGFAVAGALWAVGLRDPYCYAIAFCSGPVTLVITAGNPTAVVTLLGALAYRYGSSPAGAAIALKLYAWPILFWGLVTRGRRDFALGLALATAAIILPWALIGFDGLDRYTTVAREITSRARRESGALPLPIQVAITGLALGGMWFRRHRPSDSFAFATLAMLAASPVLWGFYLVAGLVPLAIQRRHVSVAWLLVLGLWGLDYYGRLAAVYVLLAWCGVGAPALKLKRLRPWRVA